VIFNTVRQISHHHHHIRLLEVVKCNRQHTVQKIDVGIYMDISVELHIKLSLVMLLLHFSARSQMHAVCHTSDPRQNGLKYRNAACTL